MQNISQKTKRKNYQRALIVKKSFIIIKKRIYMQKISTIGGITDDTRKTNNRTNTIQRMEQRKNKPRKKVHDFYRDERGLKPATTWRPERFARM